MRTRLIASVVALFATSACVSDQDAYIRSLGYEPVALPSTLYVPGQAMYERPSAANDHYTGMVICPSKAYAGDLKITSVPAATIKMTGADTASLNLTATVKDMLTGQIDLSAVKDTALNLTNVTVDYVDITTLHTQPPRLMSQDCGKTLSDYATMDKGVRRPYMKVIVRSLRADFDFSIQFNRSAKLTVEQKSTISDFIQSKIAAQIGLDGTNKLSGKGMYVGVDASASDLYVPKDVNATVVQQ